MGKLTNIFPSIGYCTTVHRRAEYAKVTIIDNLKTIKNLENVSQIVLDYNSPDGFKEWVYKNLMDWIDSGHLIYFKEDTMKKFQYSHAKNLAHKCAKTDIVCNLDADNFITEGFSEWLRKTLTEKRLFAKARKGSGGIQGRIAHWKSEFIALGGYDEEMEFGGHTMGDQQLN
ncbi:MAG: glycosyltransferase family A protein [Bacteroidota bacterium]